MNLIPLKQIYFLGYSDTLVFQDGEAWYKELRDSGWRLIYLNIMDAVDAEFIP